MKEIIGWIIAALIGAATVLGLAVTIAWSVNNTSTPYNEKVTACVENGGTWIAKGDMCIGADR